MDKELIAHLTKLSTLDVTAEVERKPMDIIVDLEWVRTHIELMGIQEHVDIISRAIGEIQRLRSRADELSAAAYLARSSP